MFVIYIRADFLKNLELKFLLIIIFELFDGARKRLTKKRKTNQTADLSLLNNIEKYQQY